MAVNLKKLSGLHCGVGNRVPWLRKPTRI